MSYSEMQNVKINIIFSAMFCEIRFARFIQDSNIIFVKELKTDIILIETKYEILNGIGNAVPKKRSKTILRKRGITHFIITMAHPTKTLLFLRFPSSDIFDKSNPLKRAGFSIKWEVYAFNVNKTFYFKLQTLMIYAKIW